MQRKEHFQTHSMRPPSPDKDNTKRKLQANITDEHRCKNPQQNFSKQNSATHQETKGEKIKSKKLEMKLERSQQTTQKYKGS